MAISAARCITSVHPAAAAIMKCGSRMSPAMTSTDFMTSAATVSSQPQELKRIVVDDRLDLRAGADQFLDDMRADKSVAAGDENAGVLQIFHAGPQKRLFQSSQCDGAIA